MNSNYFIKEYNNYPHQWQMRCDQLHLCVFFCLCPCSKRKTA